MRVKTLDKRSVVALALFFTPFTIFLATICPNMYWRDAPEFQTVAFQLGIAHPAGSPFYAPLGKLFTFLPFGSIAFKVNLASAFFGALLVLLTFLLITECLELIFPSKNNGLFILSGAIAVAFYAVSHSLWHNSIIAEVYTLQNCFIVLIALCLIRGLRGTEKKSFLCLAGFLFGLSTGAHIIMILYIPSLILFLWLFYRKFLSPTQLGIIVMFIILGSSVYLYLPLRSSVDPYYDWGNPENVENFITHVTDRKDAKRHFFFSPEQFIKKLKKYGQYYVEEFNILGIILGLTGIGIFLRKKPKLFLGLGAFFFSQWFFFIRYWPWSSAFIGTFLFFTVGIAVGIAGVILKVQNVQSEKMFRGHFYHFLPITLVIVCVIQVFSLGFLRWEKDTRTDYWSSYDFFKYLHDQIEFRGVLVNIIYYFGTSYLQQCENYRQDVTNLFLSEILNPRLFNTVTAKRYPSIKIPKVEGSRIGEAIMNANIMNHSFYWEPTLRYSRMVKKYLQPDGLLFHITPSPAELTTERKEVHVKKVEEFFSKYTLAFGRHNDAEENLLYGLVLENLSQFFYDHKEYSLATAHLMLASRLKPNSVSIINGLASCYATLGRFAEAERYLDKALGIDPFNIASLQNLGRLYFATERYPVSLSCYQRILKKNPKNSKAYFGIGQCYEKIGDLDKAKVAFRKVLLMNPQSDLAAKAQERLSLINY